MRKLASIQMISDLQPIENADNIMLARVLGWKVVVKKGEFQVGDRCVYVEIDSILPDKPEFEFLRNKNFRIKTMKLRGQVSQGICFPISILPTNQLEVGSDVTNLLGIKKYEPEIPISLGGDIKCKFPSFIPKTDEERIQTLDFSKLVNQYYTLTEKLDGTSSTFYVNNTYGVCGRNWEYKLDNQNAYIQISKKYDIENKLRKLNQNIALQGEIIGGKIQGNKYKRSELEVYFFKAFDIDNYSYLLPEDFFKLMKDLQLPTVPVIDKNFYIQKHYTNSFDDISRLVTISKGVSMLNTQVKREGLVYMNNESGESFKVINPDFSLKYGE